MAVHLCAREAEAEGGEGAAWLATALGAAQATAAARRAMEAEARRVHGVAAPEAAWEAAGSPRGSPESAL